MQILKVALGADYGPYLPGALPDWTPVGTVQLGDEAGALVQHRKTKRYALARDGEVQKLDQRRVLAALGKSPARKFKSAVKFTSYMPPEIRDKAGRIGRGNISDGLRIAVEAFDESEV